MTSTSQHQLCPSQYLHNTLYSPHPPSVTNLQPQHSLSPLQKLNLNLHNHPPTQIHILSVNQQGTHDNQIECNDSKRQLNSSNYQQNQLMQEDSQSTQHHPPTTNHQQSIINQTKIQNNLSINNQTNIQQTNNNQVNYLKLSNHSSASQNNLKSQIQPTNHIHILTLHNQPQHQNYNSNNNTPKSNQYHPNHQTPLSSNTTNNLQSKNKLYSMISQPQQQLINIQKEQKEFQQVEKVYQQTIDKNINQTLTPQPLVQDNNHPKLQNNKTIDIIIGKKQFLSLIKLNNNNFGIVNSNVNICTTQQIKQGLKKESEQKEEIKNQIQHKRKTIQQLKLQKILTNDHIIENKLLKDNKDQIEKIVARSSKQIQKQLIIQKEKPFLQIQFIKDKDFLKQQIQEQNDFKKLKQIENIKIVKQTQNQPINNEQLNQSKNLPNPIFLRNRKLKQTQILTATIQNELKLKQKNQFGKFQSINTGISQRVNIGKIVKNSPMKAQINSSVKKQFNIRLSSNNKNIQGMKTQKQQLKKNQQLQQKQFKKHSFINKSAFNDTSGTMKIKKNTQSKNQHQKDQNIKKSHIYQIKKQLKTPSENFLPKKEIFTKYIKQGKNQKIKSQIDQKSQKQNNRYFEFQIETLKSKDEGKKLFELQLKKNNQILDQPQQQQFPIVQQIKLEYIDFPNLTNFPNEKMSAQQMMILARETFQLFGIKLDSSITNPQQIRMVKFRNCILLKADKVNDKILWHYGGKFYYGGWKQGEGQGTKSGEGYQYVPNKYWYKGQFLDGKKNGSGRLQFIDGCNYIGQFSEGNRCGKGKFFDPQSKSYYEGQWKNNKKQGSGYLRVSEKQYYMGTFSKNVKNGYGIECYSNGDKYKGQYLNGNFHGKGKYMWSNGSWYEGNFANGYRQGNGMWKSGKNGDCYIGSYQKDKKHGFGKYFWVNGSLYEGNFENDLKNGEGKIKYDNQKQIRGLWSKGQFKQVEHQKIQNQSKFNLNKTIDLHKLNPERMPKIKSNQNKFGLQKNMHHNSEAQLKRQKNIKISMQKSSKKFLISTQIDKI